MKKLDFCFKMGIWIYIEEFVNTLNFKKTCKKASNLNDIELLELQTYWLNNKTQKWLKFDHCRI